MTVLSPRGGRCLWSVVAALAVAASLTSCQLLSRSDSPAASTDPVPSAGQGTSVAPPSTPGVVPGGQPPPTGTAIESVVDYLLPAEIGVFQEPGSGATLIAVDDMTSDLYFLAAPLNPQTGRATRTTSDAVYRFEPATQKVTKIAGLTLGADAQLFNVAATNGWVMWQEGHETADGNGPKQFHKLCLASRSDGSQLTTLVDRTVTADVAPIGCEFSAGGGSALWFDDPSGPGGDVVGSIFDTATATSKALTGVVAAPGAVNADTVVVPGEWTTESSAAVLLHPSTGSRTTVAEAADDFAIGALGVAWLTQTEAATTAMGCPLDARDPAAACTTPVRLATWQARLGEGAGLRGVAGSYVVVNPPTQDGTTTLFNLTNPSDQVPLPGGNGDYAVGGKRIVNAWSARVGGDSDKVPRPSNYLRVITLT